MDISTNPDGVECSVQGESSEAANGTEQTLPEEREKQPQNWEPVLPNPVPDRKQNDKQEILRKELQAEVLSLTKELSKLESCISVHKELRNELHHPSILPFPQDFIRLLQAHPHKDYKRRLKILSVTSITTIVISEPTNNSILLSHKETGARYSCQKTQSSI